MSLHSIVSRGLAGRLGSVPDQPAHQQPLATRRVLLPGASMSLLQTGLALAAIAAAILIGLAR